MPKRLKVDPGFADRLKQAMAGESESSFAARCPGVSRPLLRNYLSGSEPGLAKVVAIARTAGVSIAWLATGEGDPSPPTIGATFQPRVGVSDVISVGTHHHPTVGSTVADTLDDELLARVGEEIADAYRAESARISPRQLARLQARMYSDLVRQFAPEERQAGLKGMMIALRHELRTVASADNTSDKRRA